MTRPDETLRELIERGEPGDSLTELMARAYATDWDSADDDQRIWWRLKALDVREAIEASGTHCVVPLEPTEEMWRAGVRTLANHQQSAAPLDEIMNLVWGSMLAARPRDLSPTDKKE